MGAVRTSGWPALVGGSACLDFANTVGPRRPPPGEQGRDYVADYRQLVRWAVWAGVLTTGQATALETAAADDPVAADMVLADARGLREAVYRAFSTAADGDRVPAPALDVIREAYLQTLRQASLGAVSGGLDWCWPDRGSLDQVVWPIARSAVDLAVSERLARVRRCPGDDGHCGWLFLDLSKSGTRRWCSMRSCGSRVKSRRQVARVRAAREEIK
jgi:predicted RNA-binding Zn ribbon-like protein